MVINAIICYENYEKGCIYYRKRIIGQSIIKWSVTHSSFPQPLGHLILSYPWEGHELLWYQSLPGSTFLDNVHGSYREIPSEVLDLWIQTCKRKTNKKFCEGLWNSLKLHCCYVANVLCSHFGDIHLSIYSWNWLMSKCNQKSNWAYLSSSFCTQIKWLVWISAC